MVIRPKSMATVVVVFVATPVVSSVSIPAVVRTSSVRNGLISLTAPTMVVLPAPKPPATRILSACGGAASERTESMDNRLQSLDIGKFFCVGWVVSGDLAIGEQVAEQHPHHPEGEVDASGHLGHRFRFLGQSKDRLMLGAAGVRGQTGDRY